MTCLLLPKVCKRLRDEGKPKNEDSHRIEKWKKKLREFLNALICRKKAQKLVIEKIIIIINCTKQLSSAAFARDFHIFSFLPAGPPRF